MGITEIQGAFIAALQCSPFVCHSLFSYMEMALFISQDDLIFVTYLTNTIIKALAFLFHFIPEVRSSNTKQKNG